MDIDSEKIEDVEEEVVNIFLKHDIQYIESVLVCMNIMAMVSMDSGFPFEKFKQMVQQQLEGYKKNWPIG